MRRAAYLSIALSTAACAARGPASTPPRVDIPIPPAMPEPRPAHAPAASAAPAPAPPATKCGTWTEEIVRHEKTSAVARCQVVPMDATSQLVVENRALSPAKLAVRVVQDREAASGVEPAPSLDGKSYVAEQTAKGLDVRGANGGAVPDDEAARVRRLASVAVGWPGAEVAAHPPAQGTNVPALADALTAIVDGSLHGAPPALVKTAARFAGARHEPWGDVLTFDVTLRTSESDAGMCHSWTNEARLAGELLLRASDGALVSLRLRGPATNTEALCAEGAKQTGASAAPRTCNRGELTFEVHQPCFAGP